MELYYIIPSIFVCLYVNEAKSNIEYHPGMLHYAIKALVIGGPEFTIAGWLSMPGQDKGDVLSTTLVLGG